MRKFSILVDVLESCFGVDLIEGFEATVLDVQMFGILASVLGYSDQLRKKKVQQCGIYEHKTPNTSHSHTRSISAQSCSRCSTRPRKSTPISTAGGLVAVGFVGASVGSPIALALQIREPVVIILKKECLTVERIFYMGAQQDTCLWAGQGF